MTSLPKEYRDNGLAGSLTYSYVEDSTWEPNPIKWVDHYTL